jgi:hypothetical protein
MATMLSPGVVVTEIDVSAIVPTVSNSVAVFGGSFSKGPCDTYTLVSNSVELEGFYGKPTNSNYNDWYQCKTFLDYGNLLLVSRGLSGTSKNAIALFQDDSATLEVDSAALISANNSLIANYQDFENTYSSSVFPGSTSMAVCLKFLSQNPGVWGNDIEIAIVKATDFEQNNDVFYGISLDSQFDYFPVNYEFAVLIKYNDEIVERFICSFDETARDSNNRSMYVENVINSSSKYVFVKHNTLYNEIPSYFLDGDNDAVWLANGLDGDALDEGEITSAYNIFSNKEEIDIDIVIGNEANPYAAFDLADGRKDCIAFVGARYEDTVGKTASNAVDLIIYWRKGNYAI